jgi:hypothetical protein
LDRLPAIGSGEGDRSLEQVKAAAEQDECEQRCRRALAEFEKLSAHKAAANARRHDPSFTARRRPRVPRRTGKFRQFRGKLPV